jgi:hypothetical protein
VGHSGRPPVTGSCPPKRREAAPITRQQMSDVLLWGGSRSLLNMSRSCKRYFAQLGHIMILFMYYIFVISSNKILHAQSTCSGPINQQPPKESIVDFPKPKNYVSDNIYNLVLYILAFGLIALIIQSILLWRANGNAEDILKNITITLVITLGICALTIGYDQAQISPIIGLFGTIIG